VPRIVEDVALNKYEHGNDLVNKPLNMVVKVGAHASVLRALMTTDRSNVSTILVNESLSLAEVRTGAAADVQLTTTRTAALAARTG